MTKFVTKFSLKRFLAFSVIVLLLSSATATPAFSQIRISGAGGVKTVNRKANKTAASNKSKTRRVQRDDSQNKQIIPTRIDVPAAAQATSESFMEQQAMREGQKTARELLRESGVRRIKERSDRKDLPAAPGALPESRYPYPTAEEKAREGQNENPTDSPQTITLNVDTVTGPSETGAFPPDTTAAIGPTQFVVFLNGRLRTFNKTTGVADGFLNVDSDVFFASVLSPAGAGEVSFTTDPNVRYDRISNRWFLNMIDVTLNTGTGATTKVNRVLLAVSDAASNGNITGATVWTFYQFNGDATLFTDYQSFGIDASAMYIGGNMFTLAGAFNSTKGFVIPKAPSLTGSPLTVWAFSGLVATPTGAGPFSPRGADNPDPANTGATATGYFVGVDNATFNTLMIRRVTNPGSLGPAPTISANISIATPLTTRFPVLVPHLGNTGGTGGRLDSLDDRLYLAGIRNGRLWTAHNIGVNNTGVAGASNNRNAARWYELQNLGTTPSVRQSGTLFDNNTPNNTTQRNYWIPSIAVSGQGHAALGCSIAGDGERANAFTTGRLAGDTLGTLREGPGGAALPGYTASTFAYNPPGDPGGPSRRWGDYSYTGVDPLDDMSLWTFQEYTNGTNTYGVRAARLLAPPPAAIADGPGAGGVYVVAANQASVIVTINGTSVSGSGWYDPGANLPAPARPFNHITASVSGTNVTVNSITYNNPTSITLDLNTTGATFNEPDSLRNLTITNPDGQSVTRNNILQVGAVLAASVPVSGRVVNSAGRGIANARIAMLDESGNTRTTISNSFGYYSFADVSVGQSYIFSVSVKRYTFQPASQVIYVTEEVENLNFTAQ